MVTEAIPPLDVAEFSRFERRTGGVSDIPRAMMAAVQRRWDLPATRNILKLGTIFSRTETELILKSRYVVPTRLQASGFRREFPEFGGTVGDLAGGSGSC